MEEGNEKIVELQREKDDVEEQFKEFAENSKKKIVKLKASLLIIISFETGNEHKIKN